MEKTIFTKIKKTDSQRKNKEISQKQAHGSDSGPIVGTGKARVQLDLAATKCAEVLSSLERCGPPKSLPKASQEPFPREPPSQEPPGQEPPRREPPSKEPREDE